MPTIIDARYELAGALMARGDRDGAADAAARNRPPRPRMERRRGAQAAAPVPRSGRARGSVGGGAAPAAVRDPVHLMPATRSLRVPIFPLAGRRPVSARAAAAAHLRAALPRRWCATRSPATADRHGPAARPRATHPALFEIGCLGRITGTRGAGRRALQHRARRASAASGSPRELEVETPYRQVDADRCAVRRG